MLKALREISTHRRKHQAAKNAAQYDTVFAHRVEWPQGCMTHDSPLSLWLLESRMPGPIRHDVSRCASALEYGVHGTYSASDSHETEPHGQARVWVWFFGAHLI